MAEQGCTDKTTSGRPVRPLHPGFGVQLVSTEHRPHVLASHLIEELRHHRVVLVRGLPLSARSHLRLAAAMGTLVGITGGGARGRRPGLRVEREPGGFTEYWHADQSWSAQPDVVSVLACQRAGSRADPTQFADTSLAHPRLDVELRRKLDGLHAYHHVDASRRTRHPHQTDRSRPRLPARVAARTVGLVHSLRVPRGTAIHSPESIPEPGVRHPIVQQDEASGRPFIRLGDHAWRTSSGEGQTAVQVIDEINRLIVDADNVLTHHWAAGDLVIYDNRMVLHRRLVTGEPGSERTLRRILVLPTG